MAIKGWCGKPCGECANPCALDESIPCSPDCENLNEDGTGTAGCLECSCHEDADYGVYSIRIDDETDDDGTYDVMVYDKAESENDASLSQYRFDTLKKAQAYLESVVRCNPCLFFIRLPMKKNTACEKRIVTDVKTYSIKIIETSTKIVEVDAESLIEALRIVEGQYNNGDHLMDEGNTTSSFFAVGDCFQQFKEELNAAIAKYGADHIDAVCGEDGIYGMYHSLNNSFPVTKDYSLTIISAKELEEQCNLLGIGYCED